MPPSAASLPVPAEGAPTLLEREAELAHLGAALTAARRGAGSMVLIEGPAGIGKSRLLEAIRGRARSEEVGSLSARCVEFERAIPFGVATNLVLATLAGAEAAARDRLFSGPAALAAGLPAGNAAATADPDALVRGLYWLTANLTAPATAGGPPRPHLIVVDDLQWVDPPSLRFLAYLTARVDELPLLLVVAMRSGEAGDPHRLRWLHGGPATTVLRPTALSPDAVAELVADRFGSAEQAFVASCAQVSGGNPFMLEELLRALNAEGVQPAAASVPVVRQLVPESVMRSVLVRLAGLEEPATRLATALAVLGDDAPLRHAGMLAGLDPEVAEQAADGLSAASILARAEPLRFAHPLIAAAVYRDLPVFARSRMHAQAADLLYAENPASDAVAAHLLATRADGNQRTVRILRAAGQRALAGGDPAAAVRLLARALTEPPQADSRVDLLLELAEAQLHSGDDGARGNLEQALAIAADPASRSRALHALSHLRFMHGDHEGSAEAIRQALVVLEPDGQYAPDLLVSELTASAFRATLHTVIIERLAPLIEAAEEGHLPEHPGLAAHVALRLALGDGGVGHAGLVRTLAERATAADPLVDPGSHGMLAGVLVQALAGIDELADAERIAAAAFDAARRKGSSLAYALASYHRAIPRYHRGDLVNALADLEQSVAASGEVWTAGAGWLRSLQVHLLIERGELAAATSTLGLAPPPPPHTMDEAIVGFARARLAFAQHDHAGAFAHAQTAGAVLRDGFGIDHPGFLPWRTIASMAAAALGRHEEAQLLADDGLRRAQACAGARGVGQALHHAGLVSAGEQRITLLRKACAVLEPSPSRLALAHARFALGRALSRAGDRASAQQLFRLVLELADSMAANPLAAAALQELRATGARPRRVAVSGVAALTPTERRVAQLAAEGLTNVQIAQELFVTGKTIQTHLTSAYRKLGVDSRGKLRAAFDRSDSDGRRGSDVQVERTYPGQTG
jgi:DNA-binding CsgD family transcriptional regulator